MNFKATVNVMPREELADPAGQAIENAMPGAGFKDISSVRVGKKITLVVEAPDMETAKAKVTAACESFLSNPVIENFEVILKA